MTIRFCPRCGGEVVYRVPAGDERPRAVCTACGRIHYENPRVVVGAVCLCRGRVLLCRRAIEPRAGLWTVPAGYLELGETVEEGAVREAREEACVTVRPRHLLAVYSLPRIGQVQMMFLAEVVAGEPAPGHETLEVGLFDFAGIPWSELAFPTVTRVLRRARAVCEEGAAPVPVLETETGGVGEPVSPPAASPPRGSS